MVEVVVWGRVLRLQGSPVTLLEYRREFGADMLADLQTAYGRGTYGGDFLKFAWAMAKTAEPESSPFEKWLHEFSPDAFSLEDAPWEVIDSALAAEMFRGAAACEAGKFRRWLARRMGGVAKRFSLAQARLHAR